MKYTVFSVDKKRARYVRDTHRKLRGWEYVPTNCVDGRIPEQLEQALKDCPYEINKRLRVGQLGIWLTVINAFELAPVVTFEDDAVLERNFTLTFRFILKEVPDDADFVALFQPRDSDHLYDPAKKVGKWLVPAYQRYGGVSMYYPNVDRIKSLLERDGITGQYDDQLFEYAKRGELNAYTVVPEQAIVSIRATKSLVQESEWYD